MSKTKAKRAPSESPPPSIWIKSKGGTYAEITNVTKRDRKGRKLYRLRYLNYNVRSPREWTLDELRATGVRFLKNKPTAKMIEATR